ncbi:hypothetical protein [Silvanigrella sp.]|jgi:hypothetical protein|uniref:hypothetical protein n=1 Tax=Silvanigrella sp. TaxID=2024976 RepID=UPI0037C765A9
MKVFFKNCINKIFYFSFLTPLKIQAQNAQQEIPVQTPPLQGTGVQRVGSAAIPIPSQSLDLMGSPSVTLPKPQGISIQPVQMSPKKLPYDSTYMTGRIIYLNGVNINSIKNQELENVNINIDGNGNIYIDAPHYEIGVEQSYHPLMPGELPKFSKTEFSDLPVQKGVYSKETGKLAPMDKVPSSPLLQKEFAPSVPIKDQAPMQMKPQPSPTVETNSQPEALNNENPTTQKNTSKEIPKGTN